MNSLATWNGFVNALRPQWEKNTITEQLSSIVEDDDLCVAIWGCLHRQSVDWLYRGIPTLDGMRPIDLVTDDVGREKIKLILITNPWW